MNAPQKNLHSNVLKTDETNEADSIDNGDFLRTVFGELSRDDRPIIVCFEGNPSNHSPDRKVDLAPVLAIVNLIRDPTGRLAAQRADD